MFFCVPMASVAQRRPWTCIIHAACTVPCHGTEPRSRLCLLFVTAYYCDLLKDKLKPAIRTKRCGRISKAVVIFHDNARPHSAQAAVDALGELGGRHYRSLLTVQIYLCVICICLDQLRSTWEISSSTPMKMSWKRCNRVCADSQKSSSLESPSYPKGGRNVLQSKDNIVRRKVSMVSDVYKARRCLEK
jgi:hypothetical protein